MARDNRSSTCSKGVDHMKICLISAALFTIGILAGAQSDSSGVVHVDPERVAAALAYGGQMVGGKVSRPGQWLGSDITGGQTRHIGKGDVFVVPAGIPHWFKEVPKSVSYFVVKVLKP